MDENKICVFCDKQEQENNKLAYLCRLIKNNSSVSAFYGSNNISQTYITSCFHVSHVKCFLAHQNSVATYVFDCTKCKFTSNCLLPISYNNKEQGDSLYLQACYNSMVITAIRMAKVYDLDCLFMILFKHITERKGLYQYVEKGKTKTQQVQNKQISKYIQFMKQIYINADDKQRQIYDTQMQQFIQQISAHTYTYKQYRNVHQIIADIIHQIAKSTHNSQITLNPALLKQFASRVSSIQFQILLKSIASLIGEQNLAQINEQTLGSGTQYQSKLSKSFVLPPAQSSQIIDMLLKLNCSERSRTCEKKIQFQCLLCGNIICYSCCRQHVEQCHNKIFLVLQFKTTRLTLGNQIYLEKRQLYQNQFRVPLNKGYQMEGFDPKDYALNMNNLSQIITLFLEN